MLFGLETDCSSWRNVKIYLGETNSQVSEIINIKTNHNNICGGKFSEIFTKRSYTGFIKKREHNLKNLWRWERFVLVSIIFKLNIIKKMRMRSSYIQKKTY